MFSRLKEEHPEYMIGEDSADPGKSTCLDFAIPEVRQERLAVIEEVCDRYGADGIEIDDYRAHVLPPIGNQGRTLPCSPSSWETSVPSSTALANGAVNDSCWLPACIHVRTPNLSVGMDVRSWIREGFVDLVVVNYGGFQFDQDSDHEWIAEEAPEERCTGLLASGSDALRRPLS